MRDIPAAMAQVIDSGDFTGPQGRTVTRCVIYPNPVLGIYPVNDFRPDRDGKERVHQLYSSLLFRQVIDYGRELPNVRSLTWTRSTTGDIGTATFELWNTTALPAGTGPNVDDSFDLLGYYTFNRGRTTYSQTTWGHAPNEWRDVLRPDSMIITYQGYGTPDYSVPAEEDPSVVQTGVWLVDDVIYTADGLISLECRDAARLLADQISFPPVVPLPLYPQRWSTYRDVPLPDVPSTAATGWYRPVYDTSSNNVYIGDAPVAGHHGVDAFDSSDTSYWLSVGNARPNQGYSYEYIQGKFRAPVTLRALRCRVHGGPYKVYLSVSSGGVWQGKKIVPYDPNNPASGPNGSNIAYVATGRVSKDGLVTFTLPADVGNVDRVRFTFTDLWNSAVGQFKYRAAVRNVEVRGTTPTLVPGGVDKQGNYGDYTDIVRMILAWGGFYWPQGGIMYLTGARQHVYSFATADPFLQRGRIWGDLETSGTAGVADLGTEIWDKKPLLDCLGYIKDLLGFIFFVDEQGAAQWRSPNTFRLGNWLSNAQGLGLTRTLNYVTIRDSQMILGLRSKLSSRNIRDFVFVANVNGRTGAVSKGRITFKGFRRVGGWTDQAFATKQECQRMADLITLRQLFTYRVNSVRIPGDPRIQIDDQVQIEERVTGEAYRHYVSGITSRWEQETGRWEYDLSTSWLGESPSGEWAFKTDGLATETLDYLRALGQI